MDVTPLIRRNAKVIQSYKGGIFVVSGEQFQSPVIVDIAQTRAWTPSSNDAMSVTVDDFAPVFTGDTQIEVLLFGTGKTFVMLPLSFRQAFKERFGVTIDVMDTGAASRTFNVLMAEGRDVVAVMLPA